MFENVDNTQKNYDLMGGWMCNSPLQQEVRNAYAFLSSEKGEETPVSMAEALLLENFYFVIRAGRDASFIRDYYITEEKEVDLQLVETVGEGDKAWLIYKIAEK